VLSILHALFLFLVLAGCSLEKTRFISSKHLGNQAIIPRPSVDQPRNRACASKIRRTEDKPSTGIIQRRNVNETTFYIITSHILFPEYRLFVISCYTILVQNIAIGIDGGGSNTRAAIVTCDGDIVGIGTAGPSNYDNVGQESARQNIKSAIDCAWRSSGQRPRDPSAIFLGMAGVVSETDVAAIRVIADGLGLTPKTKVGVDHDIRIALAGGLAGRPGIALIAGTGSSCYGRSSDGGSWMSGGWGLLDDLGSSWWLGIQAMMSALQAYDGRGDETVLTDVVRTAFGLNSLRDLLHLYHVTGIDKSTIASLAPLVVDAAGSGDNTAETILKRGAAELTRMVVAVAENLSFASDVEITYTGGLITGASKYFDLVTSAVRSKLPQCRVVRPILPPVLGAALLARELTRLSLDPCRATIGAAVGKKIADSRPGDSRILRGQDDIFLSRLTNSAADFNVL
jgi:glucosamine kinase